MTGHGRPIGWWPAWADDVASTTVCFSTGLGRDWSSRQPTAEGWAELGAGLRGARAAARRLSTSDVIAVLDEVTRRWADPTFTHRVAAVADIVAATGFSTESVERSLDVELGNYRADDLRRALVRELGSLDVLDGFVDDRLLPGRTRAIGPRITLASLSGNVPGLPALSIVRSLLLRSSLIAKVASGEPTFARHFMHSLAEVEPVLADTVVVTAWTHHDRDRLRAALGQADAVIAYGGPEACAAIRSELSPEHRYVEHGHKVSLGLLSARYLATVGVGSAADQIAADVSTFEQLACIAPQAYLVEAGTDRLSDISAIVASAMQRFALDFPAGTRDDEVAAALRLGRLTDQWNAAVDPAHITWPGPGLDWQVTIDPSLDRLAASHRVVRLVPVRSIQHALRLIEPFGAYLQNVGLGVVDEELEGVAAALAEMGASRISGPGQMFRPSVVWRHDGVLCLASLVRWCDIEMHDAVVVAGERTRTGERYGHEIAAAAR